LNKNVITLTLYIKIIY